MKKSFLLIALALALAGGARGAKSDSHFIDTPAADTTESRGFASTVRAFHDGGVLGYIDFGVLSRLSIGASWMLEHLIGTNDQTIKAMMPALQLKIRAYDGSETLPALAVGFDNQGFEFDREKNEYAQKARGLYAVLSGELFVPGLTLSAGGNFHVDGFKLLGEAAGFAGASMNVYDKIAFILEYDNIRTIKKSRLNGAMRLYLSDSVSVDLGVREFNNKADRIAQIKYTARL
jgi:hypothetical protein